MNKKKLIYHLTFFSLLLYFIGFYIREITSGAANSDLEFHVWLLIIDFKKDLLHTLINYLDYEEATFPFFHIIQSQFNPFLKNNLYYALSNTILNLGIIFIFYYYLNKKKIFTDNLLKLLLCAVILFSPWFRSTSFWGITENFAFFFLIPACYYLNILFEKKNNFDSDFIVTLLLSLAIYSRQQYIFLVIVHLCFLFLFCEKNKFFKNLIYYIIFSIPGLITYYIWGVFENVNNATSASDYISVKYIYKNITKISTILFFYTIPIFLLNYKKLTKLILTKKYFIYFVFIFFIKIILFYNIEYPKMGGGFIIKFNYFFFKNNMILPILISSFYFSLLYCLFKKRYLVYYIILFFIYIVVGLADQLYQEWFDPFYLIAYYFLLPNKTIKSLNLDQEISIFSIYIWEFCIFLIAMFYYHFYLKIPFFYSF